MKPFKVVCINSKPIRKHHNAFCTGDYLKEGEIYTVTNILPCDGNMCYEVGLGYPKRTERFRPVDETFGEAVTETIEEQIEYYEKIMI